MGKKTRKTRWRALALNGHQSDSEESTSNSGIHTSKNYHHKFTKYPYSSQSTPIRKYQHESKSTRSNSNASDHKITFNEDEYTRITTPRQDVLFKKGYLNKPKIYQTQNSTGTSSTANSTSTCTPDHQSADGTEENDLDYESQFVFPNAFIDQNGFYYVNSFEPFPVVVYNAPICYPEYPASRTKRYSTDSLTESTSPNNEEVNQEVGQNGAPLYGQVYLQPGYYYNGVIPPNDVVNGAYKTSEQPRRLKKKRRRKLSKSRASNDASTSEYTDDCDSSDEVFSRPKSPSSSKSDSPNHVANPIQSQIEGERQDETLRPAVDRSVTQNGMGHPNRDLNEPKPPGELNDATVTEEPSGENQNAADQDLDIEEQIPQNAQDLLLNSLLRKNSLTEDCASDKQNSCGTDQHSAKGVPGEDIHPTRAIVEDTANPNLQTNNSSITSDHVASEKLSTVEGSSLTVNQDTPEDENETLNQREEAHSLENPSSTTDGEENALSHADVLVDHPKEPLQSSEKDVVCVESVSEAKENKYSLKPDAKEFVPRSLRHMENIPFDPNVQFVNLQPSFVPLSFVNPDLPVQNFPNPFLPPAIPINFAPPPNPKMMNNFINVFPPQRIIPKPHENSQKCAQSPERDRQSSATHSEAEKSSDSRTDSPRHEISSSGEERQRQRKNAREVEVKNVSGMKQNNEIDIAKIVSKIEKAAKEQEVKTPHSYNRSSHKYNRAYSLQKNRYNRQQYNRMAPDNNFKQNGEQKTNDYRLKRLENNQVHSNIASPTHIAQKDVIMQNDLNVIKSFPEEGPQNQPQENLERRLSGPQNLERSDFSPKHSPQKKQFIQQSMGSKQQGYAQRHGGTFRQQNDRQNYGQRIANGSPKRDVNIPVNTRIIDNCSSKKDFYLKNITNYSDTLKKYSAKARYENLNADKQAKTETVTVNGTTNLTPAAPPKTQKPNQWISVSNRKKRKNRNSNEVEADFDLEIDEPRTQDDLFESYDVNLLEDVVPSLQSVKQNCLVSAAKEIPICDKVSSDGAENTSNITESAEKRDGAETDQNRIETIQNSNTISSNHPDIPTGTIENENVEPAITQTAPEVTGDSVVGPEIVIQDVQEIEKRLLDQAMEANQKDSEEKTPQARELNKSRSTKKGNTTTDNKHSSHGKRNSKKGTHKAHVKKVLITDISLSLEDEKSNKILNKQSEAIAEDPPVVEQSLEGQEKETAQVINELPEAIHEAISLNVENAQAKVDDVIEEVKIVVDAKDEGDCAPASGSLETPEKKAKKKKKKVAKVLPSKTHSASSSNTTLNNLDDTYDFLLENSMVEDFEQKTNLEISEELDKMIQKGMYNSLEEKLKNLNIVATEDRFFKTIDFEAFKNPSAPEKSGFIKAGDLNSILKTNHVLNKRKNSQPVEETSKMDLSKLYQTNGEPQPSTSKSGIFLENPEVQQIIKNITSNQTSELPGDQSALPPTGKSKGNGKSKNKSKKSVPVAQDASPNEKIVSENESKVSNDLGDPRNGLQNQNVEEKSDAKQEGLYPITQAVKEWMSKTRETTPDIEILKSPNTILKELYKDDLKTDGKTKNGLAKPPSVELLEKSSKNFDSGREGVTENHSINDEVTIFSAEDWSVSQQSCLQEDLLDCWENDITGGEEKTNQNFDGGDATRKMSTKSLTNGLEPFKDGETTKYKTMEEGDDVLEMYESKYGRNEDYLSLKAEIEEQNKNVNIPKHGNLPYRAICCNLM